MKPLDVVAWILGVLLLAAIGLVQVLRVIWGFMG